MKSIPFLMLLSLLFVTGEGLACKKAGYEIYLRIDGNRAGKVALAIQHGDQTHIIDSLPTMKRGIYRFKAPKPLIPGQYLFIQNDQKLFYFLVSFERHTKLSFTAELHEGGTRHVTAAGDPENEAYFQMQRFLQDLNQKQLFTPEDVAQTDRYTDSIAAQHPNTLLAIIAQNISKPPLPSFMALNDPRVVYTSILPVRIRSLFTHIVPPHPDWVIPQVDDILERCTDPLVKAYCGEFLLHYFLSSPIMGMENAAVHIAKKYLSGELPTSNETLLMELDNYVAFNESSLMGKTAPELYLPNADGYYVSLRKVESNYTILLFYDEDCAACKELMPLLCQVYEQHRSKGVAVYAVYTQDRRQAWLNYAATLPVGWIHVWDPDFSSGFHKWYHVTGTPRLFLLDRYKTIIGREIDASILDRILSHQP